MTEKEAVSLATLKQTIQKMFESLQIVKLDGNPEYEQLHRDILKWKRKSKIEVVTCVEKLQKQLQEEYNKVKEQWLAHKRLAQSSGSPAIRDMENILLGKVRVLEEFLGEGNKP